FPVVKTDYYQGWGKSRVADAVPTGQFAPDRPVPAADAGANVIPDFLPNPVTGKPVSIPSGAKVAARQPLLKPLATTAPAAPGGSTEARIAEASRKLAMSRAWDGALNATTSYTHYIDD